MSTANAIRAWKDADYRRSLAGEQRPRPAHPSGVQLSDQMIVDGQRPGLLGADCTGHDLDTQRRRQCPGAAQGQPTSVMSMSWISRD